MARNLGTLPEKRRREAIFMSLFAVDSQAASSQINGAVPSAPQTIEWENSKIPPLLIQVVVHGIKVLLTQDTLASE